METDQGRKKIDGSDGVGAALDEGIEQLKEKLEQFKFGSSDSRRRRSSRKLLRRSCRGNFDRRASVLRRKLEKMTEDTSVKDIKEISLPSLPKKDPEAEQPEQAESATPDSNHGRQFPDDVVIFTSFQIILDIYFCDYSSCIDMSVFF